VQGDVGHSIPVVDKKRVIRKNGGLRRRGRHKGSLSPKKQIKEIQNASNPKSGKKKSNSSAQVPTTDTRYQLSSSFDFARQSRPTWVQCYVFEIFSPKLFFGGKMAFFLKTKLNYTKNHKIGF
jgi:hypothetical protein